MIEFSYLLFPAIFLVFIFLPSWRHALLPGLLAAGVAGAANSAVLRKYGMTAAHCGAAALVLYLERSASYEKKPRSLEEKMAVLAAWVTLAVLVAQATPECSWPYALDKQQMVSIFISSLFLGVV